MKTKLKGFIKFLGSKIHVSITFLVSLVNYFNLLLVIAVMYDSYNQLAGGPATMVMGLGAGGPLSILFAGITAFLSQKWKKRNYHTRNGIFLLIHLLLFIFFAYSFIELFFFTDLEDFGFNQ
jgi:hypothetical protein